MRKPTPTSISESSRNHRWRLNPRRLVRLLDRKVHGSRPLLHAFPASLVVAYSGLPEEFLLRHLQSLLPFQTRWALRYWLRRMEAISLIHRVSKKTYRKNYPSFSSWVSLRLAEEVRRLETVSNRPV